MSDAESRVRIILAELFAPLDRSSDFGALRGLAREALSLVERDSSPAEWAVLHQMYASLTMLDASLEHWPAAAATATAHYEQALLVYEHESTRSPLHAASVHLELAFLVGVAGEVPDAAAAERADRHLSTVLGFKSEIDPREFAELADSAARRLLDGGLRADPEAVRHRAIAIGEVGLASAGEDQVDLRSALHASIAEAWSRGASRTDSEHAIDHFRAALDGAPTRDRAMLQFRLGTLYLDRRLGDAADNMDAAVQLLNVAVEAADDGALSNAEATAGRLLLGKALLRRSTGTPAVDVENALALFDDVERRLRSDGYTHPLSVVDDARGDAFLARLLGDRADNVESAVACFTRSLRAGEAAADLTAITFANVRLGVAYEARVRGDHVENCEVAIRHLHAAESALDPAADPATWAQVQNNLGALYRERSSGDPADNLEQAIAHLVASLQVYTRSTTPVEWGLSQRNLALAYAERIRGDRAENLETAIAEAFAAETVFDADRHPTRRAELESTLADLFRRRVRGNRAANLEQAVERLQVALELDERVGDRRAAAGDHINLGLAYVERQAGDPAANLEASIRHLEAAGATFTRTADSHSWASLQHNLAHSYLRRLVGDRAENVEHAISCEREALEVWSRASQPHRWADCQDGLGSAYRERLGGDVADNLARSVAAHRLALEIYTRITDPWQWQRITANLALALAAHRHGDVRESLEESILRASAALEVATLDALPDEWARIHNTLGMAYLGRIAGDRDENLRSAAEHFELSLQVRTKDESPQRWADLQLNLAGVRLALGDESDVREAVAHLVGTAEVLTPQNDQHRWAMIQTQMGTAHLLLYGHTGATEDLAAGKLHYEAALATQPRERQPGPRLRTATSLGDLHFAAGDWTAADSAYQDAIETARLLGEAAYTEAGRDAVLDDVARAHTNGAYCLLQMGRPSAALEVLEAGKARTLAAALAVGDTDLAALKPETAAAVRRARTTIRDLEAEMRLPSDTPARRSDADLGSLLELARDAVREAVSAAEKDRPDFLPHGLTVPELLAAIPVGSTLIVFLLTERGGAAFILPSGSGELTQRHTIDLPDARLDWLSGVLNGSDSSIGWIGASTAARSSAEDRARWRLTIDAVTGALWRPLMHPVHERLSEIGIERGSNLILCPQQTLAMLPLHAAWREEGGQKLFLIDEFPVSYVPSGYALASSRRRNSERRQLPLRALAVIDPAEDLPFTHVEQRALLQLAPTCAVLSGRDATTAAIARSVTDRTYLHFACHGLHDWNDVTRSGLELAGSEVLTLRDILSDKLDLSSTRLVTLSACETGLTDVRRSAEEYVGLPTGFLQAGAASVLATLWAVDDLSTALVVDRFLRRHLALGRPAAEALREAQLEVRRMTYRELLATRLLEIDGSGITGSAGTPIDHDKLVFAEPYFWAAFSLTGT